MSLAEVELVTDSQIAPQSKEHAAISGFGFGGYLNFVCWTPKSICILHLILVPLG